MDKIYELVSMKEDKSLTTEYLQKSQLVEKNLIQGINENEKSKEELRGEPKLKGFLGPMYGGEKDGKVVIRYETSQAYKAMSS